MKQRFNYKIFFFFFLKAACHSKISEREIQWQTTTTKGSTCIFVNVKHLVQKLQRTVMAQFIFIARFDDDWMLYRFHSKLCSVYVCCVKTWLHCSTDPSKGHQLLDNGHCK